MKQIYILVILCTLIATFFALRSPAPNLATTAQSNNKRQRPTLDLPFWEQAVIPEPEITRPTSRDNHLIAPIANSPDPATEVIRLAAAGDFENLNFAFATWFDRDPIAARDWLALQKSLDNLQPAIAMVAGKIAQDGDPTNGLEWAKLLHPGSQQEQTYFDIYALAARQNQFTPDQLKSAPLPAARIEELLSGAAGD